MGKNEVFLIVVSAFFVLTPISQMVRAGMNEILSGTSKRSVLTRIATMLFSTFIIYLILLLIQKIIFSINI